MGVFEKNGRGERVLGMSIRTVRSNSFDGVYQYTTYCTSWVMCDCRATVSL